MLIPIWMKASKSNRRSYLLNEIGLKMILGGLLFFGFFKGITSKNQHQILFIMDWKNTLSLSLGNKRFKQYAFFQKNEISFDVIPAWTFCAHRVEIQEVFV